MDDNIKPTDENPIKPEPAKVEKVEQPKADQSKKWPFNKPGKPEVKKAEAPAKQPVKAAGKSPVKSKKPVKAASAEKPRYRQTSPDRRVDDVFINAYTDPSLTRFRLPDGSRPHGSTEKLEPANPITETTVTGADQWTDPMTFRVPVTAILGVAGTFTGTVVFQQSTDEGVTWTTLEEFTSPDLIIVTVTSGMYRLGVETAPFTGVARLLINTAASTIDPAAPGTRPQLLTNTGRRVHVYETPWVIDDPEQLADANASAEFILHAPMAWAIQWYTINQGLTDWDGRPIESDQTYGRDMYRNGGMINQPWANNPSNPTTNIPLPF